MFYMHSIIFLTHFTLRIVNMHSIFIFNFFGIYQVFSMDLPHHAQQVTILAMSHLLQSLPFQTSLVQLLYEIFFEPFSTVS
jgi:hypothetical protein